LHLRRGSYDNMNLLIPTEYMEDAVSVDYAAKVREQAGIQVISDGNISLYRLERLPPLYR